MDRQGRHDGAHDRNTGDRLGALRPVAARRGPGGGVDALRDRDHRLLRRRGPICRRRPTVAPGAVGMMSQP